MHYQSAKAKGTLPLQWKRAQRAAMPIEKKLDIMKRVHPETGCWEWTGRLSEDGYGKVPVASGRYGSVHRLSYQLKWGSVPDGLEIDHVCRNRRCFNPDHLEAVTRRENVRRGALPEMMRKKATDQTHCRLGHPLSGSNLVLQGPEKKFRVCRICRATRQRYRYHNRKEKIHEGF